MISKKLLLALVGLGLTTIGFVLTGFLPLLGAQFTIYVGAVTGLVGLGIAGHVSGAYIDNKAVTDQHAASVTAQASVGQLVDKSPAVDPVAPVQEVPVASAAPSGR